MLSGSVDVMGAGSTVGYQGGIAVVKCSIPGYETGDFYLSPSGTCIGEMESLSLNSAIEHPGGVVELKCDRVWNPAFVCMASLTVISVGFLA